MLFFGLIFINLLFLAQSKTVFYEFHIAYAPGAPDGVFKDKILSVNGQFPGPLIEAEVGDHVHVVVHNDIDDGQNVTIHWHGIEQNGTPFDDGANMLTQCPIKHGDYQEYFFQVRQAGTYWYHSHIKSQYTEGLWGPLIVRNPTETHEYAGEFLMALSDWYHRSAHQNEYWYISLLSGGFPPYPDSALINGLGRYPCDIAAMRSFLTDCSGEAQKRFVYRVVPNSSYRIRVVNTAALSVFLFSIDGHKLKVIEVDGIEVEDTVEVDDVTMAPGQRYSFLVTMDLTAEPPGRHLIRATLQTQFLGGVYPDENVTPFPEALQPDATAVIKYRGEEDADLPDVTTEIHDFTEEVEPIRSELLVGRVTLDPFTLKPADGDTAPAVYDKQFKFVSMPAVDPSGITRMTFNGSFFHLPDYPLLMTVMDGKELPDGVMPHIIEFGDVVEVVINNAMGGPHPFHLHGHHFWVVGAGGEGDGEYEEGIDELNLEGAKRDTIYVLGNSWGVIRFVADNPGVWNFHCHFDWHNLSGMTATFIEASAVLRTEYTYTPEAVRVCAAHGIELPETRSRRS